MSPKYLTIGNYSVQINHINISKRQLKWAGLVGALVVLLALAYVVGDHNIRVYGEAVPVGFVSGDSMLPVLGSGQWFYYYTVDKMPVQNGSIILYSKAVSKRAVVHRVVRVLPDGSYITKGDNNPGTDQELKINSREVYPSEVLGVVGGPLKLF